MVENYFHWNRCILNRDFLLIKRQTWVGDMLYTHETTFSYVVVNSDGYRFEKFEDNLFISNTVKLNFISLDL